MLKDFFRNLLTDEDDEYEDEYEEEEEETEETIAETPVSFPQQNAQPDQLYVEPEIQTTKNTYIHDPQAEAPRPVEDKPTFTGLNVDDLEEKPKKKTGSGQPYKYDRNKLPKSRPVRQESPADYQAVISPIFGNMDESQKEFDKVHNAVDLPKPAEDFVYVQVISPMYGSDLPDQSPVDSIPTYQEANLNSRNRKPARKNGKAASLDLSEMTGKQEDNGPKGSR